MANRQDDQPLPANEGIPEMAPPRNGGDDDVRGVSDEQIRDVGEDDEDIDDAEDMDEEEEEEEGGV
jgi:hypothetical protein